MFKSICFVFGILSCLPLTAQVDLAQIPDSLMEKANAVILQQNEVVEIFNISQITHSVVSKTLVLSPLPTAANSIYIFYDKFEKIDDINIYITTPDGKKLKTIKRKDMSDRSYYDNVGSISDDRYLFYNVVEPKLPYVVNVEYKRSISQSFHVPRYFPIRDDEVSILNSTFTIINHDINNKIRFDCGYWPTPQADTTTNIHTYTLNLSNLTVPKVKSIVKSKSKLSVTPILETFQMESITGNINSWSSFGSWLAKLSETADNLDASAVQDVRNIIADEGDKYKIVDKLYTYLKQNMRYVSIQLGIGGFRPMPAQDVHKNKYGDCKALSYYMKSILKVAEIPSYYTVIEAGDHPRTLSDSFPINTFTHAILTVPMDQDTLFLECTSQTNPIGYLGGFTGNRRALLINGSESKVIHTKTYDHLNNQIKNNFELSLGDQKEYKVSLQQELSDMGTEHHDLNFTSSMSDEKFKTYILDRVMSDIKDLEIISRDYTIDAPKISIGLKFAHQKKIQHTGSRTFIDPNIDPLPSAIQDALKDTETHLNIPTGYTIDDHFKIQIAPGCRVEKTPAEVEVASDVGLLSQKVIQNDASYIILHRKSVYRAGKYSIADQNEAENFVNTLKKWQREKIVINCKS
ncbi:MAG: DUF3857 domain-containing protein [Saprospiraceae bacterium]